MGKRQDDVVLQFDNSFFFERVPFWNLCQSVHERLRKKEILLSVRLKRGPQRPHRVINIEEKVEEQPGTPCTTISCAALADIKYSSRAVVVYVHLTCPACAFSTWFLRQVPTKGLFSKHFGS